MLLELVERVVEDARAHVSLRLALRSSRWRRGRSGQLVSSVMELFVTGRRLVVVLVLAILVLLLGLDLLPERLEELFQQRKRPQAHLHPCNWLFNRSTKAYPLLFQRLNVVQGEIALRVAIIIS